MSQNETNGKKVTKAGLSISDWLIGGLVLAAGVWVALVNPPAGGNIVLLGLICLVASVLLPNRFTSLVLASLFVGYTACWLVTVVIL